MESIIYVNGKRVTKEELSNIEIHDEEVKRILAGHLRRKNKTNEECVNG